MLPSCARRYGPYAPTTSNPAHVGAGCEPNSCTVDGRMMFVPDGGTKSYDATALFWLVTPARQARIAGVTVLGFIMMTIWYPLTRLKPCSSSRPASASTSPESIVAAPEV